MGSVAKENKTSIDKFGLDEETMALRVVKEFEDGMVVNLGPGIPSLAGFFVPEGKEILGKEVLLHADNGVLGFGPVASPAEADFDLTNASSQPVTSLPGISFFSNGDSLDMIRGGHIDLCVMGALQVSEQGDLANWVKGDLSDYWGDMGRCFKEDELLPGIGGAMDLAVGAKKLIVAMRHTTKTGVPKIVKRCTFELTAPQCVSRIITDVAVIDVTPQGLLLKEVAPGWSVEEVQEITEPVLHVAPGLKEIEI